MGTRLESKTALVTGATSNIGRAIATRFYGRGAHVVVSGCNHEPGAEGTVIDVDGGRVGVAVIAADARA